MEWKFKQTTFKGEQSIDTVVSLSVDEVKERIKKGKLDIHFVEGGRTIFAALSWREQGQDKSLSLMTSNVEESFDFLQEFAADRLLGKSMKKQLKI